MTVHEALLNSYKAARSRIAPGLATTSMAQKSSEFRGLFGRPTEALSLDKGQRTQNARAEHKVPSMSWAKAKTSFNVRNDL